MRRSLALLATLAVACPLPLGAAEKRPKFPILDPPVRLHVAISESATKNPSTLKWKLDEIRKRLAPNKKKEWRYHYWLQLVDRPEDAEVLLELTDYERKILGHGYMDNIYLSATMARAGSTVKTPITARALEKDNATVEEYLLFKVCDAVEPFTRDRVK